MKLKDVFLYTKNAMPMIKEADLTTKKMYPILVKLSIWLGVKNESHTDNNTFFQDTKSITN